MSHIDIEAMPVAQKLLLIEALWDSLIHTPAALDDGARLGWHTEALQRAESALTDGRARFIDWDAAKQALNARSRA